MEFVYYTVAGLILYFVSDWILSKIEQLRGEVFEQRTLIFFVIVTVLALSSFKAIENLVNSGTELQLYSVNNITSGTDSQGEVTVRLQLGGRIVNGQGADTDIVIASTKAYINALNKIILRDERAHPQLGDV